MKIFSKVFSILALAAILISTSIPEKSFAQSVNGAAATRQLFSSDSLGITIWDPVMTSLPRSISGIMIANNSSVALQVGTCSSGSVAQTEVQRLIVPPGVTGGQNPMVFYPIQVSAGYRISIRGYSSTAVGEGDFNFIFN